MSNLGGYQVITTFCKKVGGPLAFVLVVAGSGYAILRSVEAGGKIVYKKIKDIKAKNSSEIKEFTVHTDGVDNQGLSFKTGDKIRVLEAVDDAILIEKVGDNNNPYFVSSDFLKTISDFSE